MKVICQLNRALPNPSCEVYLVFAIFVTLLIHNPADFFTTKHFRVILEKLRQKMLDGSIVPAVKEIYPD